MQTRTRDRGAQTSRPTIETSTHVMISDTGRQIEMEYDKRGMEAVLAQFIFEGDTIYHTAQDRAHLLKIYAALEDIFSCAKTRTIKKITGDISKFSVTTYEWNGDKYEYITHESMDKPPKKGIWLAPSPSDSQVYTPRIYQKLAGQLVLKADRATTDIDLLRSLRRTLPSIKLKYSEATPHTINQPLIEIGMTYDFYDSERALAKIGLNLLAHTFGREFLTHPEFDTVKSSILTGVPELPFSSFGEENKDAVDDIFGNVPPNHHCLMLMAVPTGPETCDIYFNAKFYGVGAHKIILATDSKTIELLEFKYFLVNFETNKIECFSMTEYQLKHGTIVDKYIADINRI